MIQSFSALDLNFELPDASDSSEVSIADLDYKDLRNTPYFGAL